jgi:enoyl-[acyl-carrier protein] reductase II
MVCDAVKIPVIAAGGIATGRGMLAAFALGAEGIQAGSRFAATEESSAHPAFKQKIAEAQEGDTFLSMKKLIPVRLLRNPFQEKVAALEARGASPEELLELLGQGRSRRGMFEGDLDEGELEIGQAAAQILTVEPAARVVEAMVREFYAARENVNRM